MKQNAYRVSRATIYNTLDILVECDLVMRHHFGVNKTLYEKSFGFPVHDHLICTTCGEIEEFNDERIDQIIDDHTHGSAFRAERRSLNVFGLCRECGNSK